MDIKGVCFQLEAIVPMYSTMQAHKYVYTAQRRPMRVRKSERALRQIVGYKGESTKSPNKYVINALFSFTFLHLLHICSSPYEN